MDLFVCWANAQRSQVAEAFSKKLWKKVISCASIEDKKEKYFHKPEKIITRLVKDNFDINISNQKILYPNDILEEIKNIDNIYFLYNPKEARIPDNKLLINWMTFRNYLESIWKKYEIYEIKEPDEDINTFDSMLEIVYDIDRLVKRIYFFEKKCKNNKKIVFNLKNNNAHL